MQPEMRDLVMRNGMQTHIVPAGEGYQLVVQGHDSPLIRYPISKQLFSKVFNEVDMKTRPEMLSNLGAKIFAVLAAGTVVVSDLAHGIHHHPCPELYGEHFCHALHPYFKPRVDSPRDVAARNFEAQMNQEVAEMRRGF